MPHELLARRLGPHGAYSHLHAAQLTARMTLELAEPNVILLHHNDIERNLAIRRLQPRHVGIEFLGVERLRFDRTSTRPPCLKFSG